MTSPRDDVTDDVTTPQCYARLDDVADYLMTSLPDDVTALQCCARLDDVTTGVKEAPADCIGMAEVRAALKKMKRHKAPGLSGLVAEMIQPTGEIGTQWLLDVSNGIVKEGCIPEDWKSSVVLPIYAAVLRAAR